MDSKIEKRSDYVQGFPKVVPISILISITPFLIAGAVAWSNLKNSDAIIEQKLEAEIYFRNNLISTFYNTRKEDLARFEKKFDGIEIKFDKIETILTRIYMKMDEGNGQI